MFTVEVRRDTRGVVFTLRGDLDFHSVVQLYEAGEEELGTGEVTGAVVIDCAHLAYCDSTGISALLKLYHQMSAQDGVLCLASVTDNLNRLFELTGLKQIFCLHIDPEEALDAHLHVPGAVAAGADSSARTGTEHGG